MLRRYAALILGPLAALSITCSRRPDDESVKDVIRSIERQRLRALVEADVVTARRLHADDFQLISPSGGVFSKERYMGEIESGGLLGLQDMGSREDCCQALWRRGGQTVRRRRFRSPLQRRACMEWSEQYRSAHRSV